MNDLLAHALAEICDALIDIVDRLELLLPPESNAEPKVRLMVDVPESLHTRIKIACSRNELKMNALIQEGVHRGLERYEQEQVA